MAPLLIKETAVATHALVPSQSDYSIGLCITLPWKAVWKLQLVTTYVEPWAFLEPIVLTDHIMLVLLHLVW